jgi:hypothetical protein
LVNIVATFNRTAHCPLSTARYFQRRIYVATNTLLHFSACDDERLRFCQG